MKIFYTTMFLLIFSVLSAQETDKLTTSGPALSIGTGVVYGGLGVQGEYQYVIKDYLRFTPAASIGFSLGGTDTSKAEYYWLNYVLGVNLEFGKKHRLILGPQYIGSYNLQNKPANAPIYSKSPTGASFIVGYKGGMANGVIWQMYLGAAYIKNPLLKNSLYTVEPHVGFGIGYKF